MVEVPRQSEYSDYTPDAFGQVVKGLDPALAKVDTKSASEAEEELNLRLKSLGQKRIEVGHPENLGPLFRKSEAAGFGLLMAYRQNDRSVTMACGIAVLRVKQRLVFTYLYRRYASPETVTWVRKNLEGWADAILAKNK
jgi:hypothetical protein